MTEYLTCRATKPATNTIGISVNIEVTKMFKFDKFYRIIWRIQSFFEKYFIIFCFREATESKLFIGQLLNFDIVRALCSDKYFGSPNLPYKLEGLCCVKLKENTRKLISYLTFFYKMAASFFLMKKLICFSVTLNLRKIHSDLYFKLYPERQQPHKTMFGRIVGNLKKLWLVRGSYKINNWGRRKITTRRHR